MMRETRRALLALCLLAVPAPGALAKSVDLTSRPAIPGGSSNAIAPAFTADGGIVFGIAPTPKLLAVWRLAPGATAPRELLRLAQPDPATYTSLVARVIAAGPGGGFLLDRSVNRGQHDGFTSHLGPKLTLYRVPGEGGIALPDCSWGCFSCAGAFPAEVAADASSVLIAPVCTTGPPVNPIVYDIATGTRQDVSSPPYDAHIAGAYVSGAHPGSDGGGVVVDRTTGALVRTVAGMTSHALLPDGTVFYRPVDGTTVMRLGPGDSEPVSTGAEGDVAGLAGNRLLTQAADSATDGATVRYRVWTLDGTLVGDIDGLAPGAAFDGHRLAFLEMSCMTTRLQIWDVGSAPPDRLPTPCATPTAAAPGALGRRAASVRLTCPATAAQGCMGTAQLAWPPIGQRHGYSLPAGRSARVKLAEGFHTKSCRTLERARRWRIVLALGASTITDTTTVSVSHSRPAHC